MDFADFQVKVYSSAAPATIITYYTVEPKFDFTFEANLNSFGVPRASVTIEVRARDNTGNLSSMVTATATNAAPADVTGLTAAGISDAVSLRWTANTDDDLKYYKVRHGTSSGTVTSVVYTGAATAFVYDSVLTAVEYFSVVAVDVFGTESATPTTANATPRSTFSVDTTAPATPTSVTVSTALDSTDPSGSRAYIDVSWTGVADTDLQNYSVRYSTSSLGPWEYINVPEGIVTSRINSLKSGTAYYVAVGAVDFVGNASAYANAGTFPITTSTDTTAPSTPSAPTIAANALQIQVTHDGLKAAGGSLESDLDHFDVYASTTTGFTPGATSLIGQIGNGPAKVASFPVPASASSGTSQTWYAKVVAVDYSGNRSTASAQSSASVPLIAAVNIGDAVITNAKIADLAADKITAGSGIINNLLIKSTLTVDTAGTVQSGNFNDTTKVGWQLANTTLKLYDGTVYARALVLKNGENLMLSQYADFEWSAYWYTTYPLIGAHDGGSEVISVVDSGTTTAKYNSQCVSMVRTASAGTYSRVVFTTTSASTYNLTLEASTDYIVSGWFKTPNASGNKTISLNLNSTSGSVSGSSQVLTADGTWYRFSQVLTTNTDTLFALDVKLFTAGTLYIDGLQIEQKRTAETTPSQWRPPSVTTIDGGSITTGSIRSTASANGLSGQPAWSISVTGAAQFGDAAVRGRLVVGDISNPSGDGTNSIVQSANYVASSTGWAIRQDGFAEFSNVAIRGTGTGTILTAGSSANAQVLIGTSSSAGFLKFFTHSTYENVPALVLTGIVNSGAANENISLQLQGPSVTSATDRLTLGLFSQNHDGTSEASVTISHNVNGTLWFVNETQMRTNVPIEMFPSQTTTVDYIYLKTPSGASGSSTFTKFIDGSSVQQFGVSLDGYVSTYETTTGGIRIGNGNDVSLSSTNHGFQIGIDSGANIVIDTNEIMARNNGATNTLNLNIDGGDVHMGGDLVVEGVGQVQFARRSSDATKTSTATVVDDTQITFSVDASCTYEFRGMCKYSGGTTGDFKMGFSFPTGSLGEWTGLGNGTTVFAPNGTAIQSNATSTGGYMVRTESTDIAATRAYGGVSTSDEFCVQYRGILRTSTTAGTFALQWAQNNSEAVATTLYADSYMVLTKVA
jgi:hypothetical protein